MHSHYQVCYATVFHTAQFKLALYIQTIHKYYTSTPFIYTIPTIECSVNGYVSGIKLNKLK